MPTLFIREYLPLLTTNTSDPRSPMYSIGKPVVLAAFGLVTQDNLLQFVPVNDTCPAVDLPHQSEKRKPCCTTSLGRYLSKNVICRFL